MITSTLSDLDTPPIPYKVDMALDDEGFPHFVYALREQVSLTDTVYYVGRGVHEKVPDSTRSSNPAIAWSGGYAHVVWEEAKVGGTLEIMYNRRDITGTWEHPPTPPTSDQGTLTKPPRNPDVAAYGDSIVVVWDWQWTETEDQYVLAYTHYLTSEERWVDAYEVGTPGGSTVEPLILGDAGLREPPYYTYNSMIEVAQPVILHYLRPSVVLNREGLPAVVWHADNGTYDIMYSQAQSRTTSVEGHDIFSWLEPTVFNRSSAGDSASPVIAQALVVSPTLHVAYSHNASGSEDWETYYEGREAGYIPGDYDHTALLPVVLRNFDSRGIR
jgi:hypothetical protein